MKIKKLLNLLTVVLTLTTGLLTTVNATHNATHSGVHQDASRIGNLAGQQILQPLSAAKAALYMASNTATTANEAVGIARGTRATLVNQDGCVYNSNFDCTEDTLTYRYQTTNHTESWTTPGNHTWTAPTGVTSIYILAKSGKGGRMLCGRSGTRNHNISTGERSRVTSGSITLLETQVGRKNVFLSYEDGDSTCITSGVPSRSSNSRTVGISSEQRISIIVGSGVGVHGSVIISYTRNIRI